MDGFARLFYLDLRLDDMAEACLAALGFGAGAASADAVMSGDAIKDGHVLSAASQWRHIWTGHAQPAQIPQQAMDVLISWQKPRLVTNHAAARLH